MKRFRDFGRVLGKLVPGRRSTPPPRVNTRRPRIQGAWLRTRERKPVVVDGVASIGLSVLIIALFEALDVHIPGPGGEAIVAVTAVVLAYLVVSQITNLMVGDLVRKVHAIGAAAEGWARITMMRFVDRHLERLDEQIQQLTSAEGVLLDIEEVKFWTEMCFEFGDGHYDGTDSHLPSEFERVFPKYLRAHGEMLRRHPKAPQNSRILIGPPNEFRNDYINNYDTGYEGFLAWHKDKVPLLHIDRERAESLRPRLRHVERASSSSPGALPTLDMAIWHGQYALLFRDEPDVGKIRLWMRHSGDNWYEQCRQLVDLLRGTPAAAPQAATLRDAVPEIFEGELCLHWEDFVNPSERIQTLGPFLEHVLGDPASGSVLDAAAGIGSDARWLTDRGYDVTLNEIEPVYRELIKRRFGTRGVRLHPADWRELPQHFSAWFDSVLVLGNSLCLLGSPDEQSRAIRAFMSVLKPGGQLVIDERNFDHFWSPEMVERIERNPIRNFPYGGRALYCGEKVKGCPKTLSEDEVVFRYYESDKAFEDRMHLHEDLTDADRRDLDRREVGILHLYPFKRGELARRLADCGFVDIHVYVDLDTSDPRTCDSDEWFEEHADFFTYTARKPLEDPERERRSDDDQLVAVF
jgi:glycine/sarcosine N-methyltransferase